VRRDYARWGEIIRAKRAARGLIRVATTSAQRAGDGDAVALYPRCSRLGEVVENLDDHFAEAHGASGHLLRLRPVFDDKNAVTLHG